jgi:hypothetical protein
MNVLIAVVSQHRRVFDISLENNRQNAYSFYTEKVSPDEWHIGGNAFYEVDERDVERAIDTLTTYNPGKLVYVYTLTRTATRPAQKEILHSVVTKEGVLPA